MPWFRPIFFNLNSFNRFWDISKKRSKKTLFSCKITILDYTLYGKVKKKKKLITELQLIKILFINMYLNTFMLISYLTIKIGPSLCKQYLCSQKMPKMCSLRSCANLTPAIQWVPSHCFANFSVSIHYSLREQFASNYFKTISAVL